LAEEVEAANCGISVAPEDPDALADALVRLADDRTLLGQYSRRSRQLAEERFSRDEASKAFVAVLEDTWSEWQTSKK
jgi:glycosyltransferase involved in cell wall biosynthesis